MKSIRLLISILSICFFTNSLFAQDLYVGAWSSGSDGHYLWSGVEWDSFKSKWEELSKDNLRLIDIETYTEGRVRKYTGVWRSGSDGHYLWAGVEWDSFKAKWEELAKDNLRLIDVETYMEGRVRKYTGVWRSGSDGHYLWAGVEWDSFKAKWEELAKDNLRLIDIETYMESGVRKYTGVWRSGSDGHYLWAGVEWGSFKAKWEELAKDNLRLVDIETYMESGVRKYTGVWRSGSDGYHLWAGVDWENFVSKWAENEANGMRLIDIETYESSCQTNCLNKALMPDDPDTPNRDTYNYGVTGGDLHCEANPNSCSGLTDNVLYRWPSIEYGGTHYLRLSAMYSTKDQIFTLPFNDKPDKMQKNGWRYSSGDWHHALDYSRKDGKTFKVRATARGKVIHIGWDYWSGGTVVLSHDAGGKSDVYRTIYMHLRNGAKRDCESAWSSTMTSPNLSDDQKADYKAYLEATGCFENIDKRKLDKKQWGKNSNQLDLSLLGKSIPAGKVLGCAGDTGPGGCGCMTGGTGPNTHLHLFFAHRDPTDDQWYLFDPYGIYGTPDCYPSEVDGAINSACSRYPVSWKRGKPSYN